MPTTLSVAGSISGSVSTTNEAKYRPALSLTTVTVDGADGRERDHFTATSPTLGSRSFPPVVIFHPAFAVNRTACRVSLRDFKRGGPIVGRLPLRPSKKFRYAASRSRRDCCNTTEDTSSSHARWGVFFATVSCLDSSAEGTNGSPAARACSRTRSASLKTTRAHPNALANAVC